jgi:LPXTG-motif cell wall-anchored protein
MKVRIAVFAVLAAVTFFSLFLSTAWAPVPGAYPYGSPSLLPSTCTQQGLGIFCINPDQGPPGTTIEVSGYFFSEVPSTQLRVVWDQTSEFAPSGVQSYEFLASTSPGIIGEIRVPEDTSPGEHSIGFWTCCPSGEILTFTVTGSVNQDAYPDEPAFSNYTALASESRNQTAYEVVAVLPKTGMALLLPAAGFALAGLGGLTLRRRKDI